MNIGIDLDGVIFDSEIYNRAYADYFDYTHNGGRGNCIRSEAHVQGRYSDWSEELMNQFLREYLLVSQEQAPLLPLAKEMLAFLRSKGHCLVLVSNRGAIFDEEIEIAERRLKEEEIEFDAYQYYAKDKFSVCQEEKIDVMLDDHYKNVAQLSENGVACIYFRDRILKFCDNPNVIEVDTWGQVPAVLDYMAQHKEIFAPKYKKTSRKKTNSN